MVIVSKPTRVCDDCGRVVKGKKVKVEAPPNGDGSKLFIAGKPVYDFSKKDFCSINCFFRDIRKAIAVGQAPAKDE